MEFCELVDEITPKVPRFTKLVDPQATYCFEGTIAHKICNSTEAVLEMPREVPLDTKTDDIVSKQSELVDAHKD
eukprot:7319973-Pyramimonas_sp.AAC.1